METISSTTSYTKAHIERVRAKMEFFASILALRGVKHDKSKLVEPECYGWLAMDREPKYTFGSPEYYDKMQRYKEVLKHHYTVNTHHPEHFSDPNSQMDLIDLVEMLCDWFSYKSEFTWLEAYNRITQQCERFGFNITIKNLLLNTFKHFLVKSALSEDLLAEGSEKFIADVILRKIVSEKGWDNLQSTDTQDLVNVESQLDSLLSAQHICIESLKEFYKDVK